MNRTVQNRLPSNAREAISLIYAIKTKKQAVSTVALIKEVRRSFPYLATSDAALTDCIAGTANTLDLMVVLDYRVCSPVH